MYRFAYQVASGSGVSQSVSPKPGFFHTLLIGQCTSAGTLALYDNNGPSGSLITRVNVATTSLLPVSLPLDTEFHIGLYIQFETFAGVVTLAFK